MLWMPPAAAAKERGSIAIIAIHIAQEREKEREFTVTFKGCCVTAIVQFK